MTIRKASIKETGEEISQAEWARFDAAVARAKAERSEARHREPGLFENGHRAVPRPELVREDDR